MNKKIVFYTGYSPAFNGDDLNNPSSKSIGGSEIALIQVAELLIKKGYDVFVFGFLTIPGIVNGVSYRRIQEFMSFVMTATPQINTIIISRFANGLIHVPLKADKVYLWLHDMIAHPDFMDTKINNNSALLLLNMRNKITGLVCLTDFHEWFLKNHAYQYLQAFDGPFDEKNSPNESTHEVKIGKYVHIIPNGVDKQILEMSLSGRDKEVVPTTTSTSITKKTNSFIYASHHDRGLDVLLRLFEKILKNSETGTTNEVGTANAANELTLTIAGESTKESVGWINNYVSKYPKNIFFVGKLKHSELFQRLQETEYWFYPTSFPETYCMTALEAQLAGCVCIAYDSGALRSVISDRGIVFEANLPEEIVVAEVQRIMRDENLKNELKTRAQAWAKKQTWESRVEHGWVKLIEN